MLNLSDLEQFVTFADCGTLSQTAEKLHISQPTLTRTMHHVEDAFGVPLFNRGRNRITLNATGERAVEHARKLLFDAAQAITAVQTFDRSLRTISVASCAPAPLWTLVPALSSHNPEHTISAKIMNTPDVLTALTSGTFTIGILPRAVQDPDFIDVPYLREVLSVAVPKEHPLATATSLNPEALNGYNCLLRDELGFWSALAQEKMPASRFLVQTDAFAFDELVRHSTLLCFVTNLAPETPVNRRIIPIDDESVDVTYHLICHKKDHTVLAPFRR